MKSEVLKKIYKKVIFFGICCFFASTPVFSEVSYALNTIDTNNPQIYIKAVNPGYTVDGIQNTGELIELKRSSEDSLLLTDLTIRYTNSSGENAKSVFDFSDGSELVGESLLFRLASASDGKDADLTYTSPNIAMGAGKIELVVKEKDGGEKIIHKVCWGKFNGEEDCLVGFNSKKPTSIVFDEESKTFSHQENYVPEFSEERKAIILPEEGKGGEEDAVPQCRGLIFSEIFSYYENSKSEQFIEFFNSTDTQINLRGCVVRYKNKNYPLEGIVQPERYFAFFPNDFALTKNPTSENIIEIVDADGKVVDSLSYYNGQKRGVSYAMFGYDESGKEIWLQTFALTPNTENNYQKYKSCEDGKVLNEETGNCVNATKVSTELAPCPEGSYRNPLTNRCKKYESEASATIKECAEGYTRNPATNRCRKNVVNDGAKYEIKTENFEEKSSFVAIWAIVGVGVVGAIYVIFEYRKEIAGVFRKK